MNSAKQRRTNKLGFVHSELLRYRNSTIETHSGIHCLATSQASVLSGFCIPFKLIYESVQLNTFTGQIPGAKQHIEQQEVALPKQMHMSVAM